jgi:hypothetical protein
MRFAQKFLRPVALAAVAIALTSSCTVQQQPANSNNAANSNQPTTTAGAAAPANTSLSPVIPHDADFSDNPSTIQAVQHDFDVFSWQSFVALNWPTNPDGTVNPNKMIGADGDNPTVWDVYKESYEVFLPDGQQPLPWGQRELPLACQSSVAGGNKVIRMTQKVSDDVLNFSGEPFGTGPLIDLNGQYTRYEIRLNEDAFNYIVQNMLYNKQGQAAFTQPVQFPTGTNGANQPVGGMVIKAAWRVLGPDDHPERYHTVKAYVYTPASTNPPTNESCVQMTMGLVGFHIAHKTASASQWVWSTFEQVDNVQVGPNAPAGLKPTYYNPDCSNCPINKPPPKPWNPNAPKSQPAQILRLIPIDSATQQLNAQWQGMLKGVNPNSVWQYYQLISTQWPTAAGKENQPSGSLPAGNPAPQFLANATLETYIQGQVPNVSSSCIICHNNATTTNAKFADFSYLLERAKEKK